MGILENVQIYWYLSSFGLNRMIGVYRWEKAVNEHKIRKAKSAFFLQTKQSYDNTLVVHFIDMRKIHVKIRYTRNRFVCLCVCVCYFSYFSFQFKGIHDARSNFPSIFFSFCTNKKLNLTNVQLSRRKLCYILYTRIDRKCIVRILSWQRLSTLCDQYSIKAINYSFLLINSSMSVNKNNKFKSNSYTASCLDSYTWQLPQVRWKREWKKNTPPKEKHCDVLGKKLRSTAQTYKCICS